MREEPELREELELRAEMCVVIFAESEIVQTWRACVQSAKSVRGEMRAERMRVELRVDMRAELEMLA